MTNAENIQSDLKTLVNLMVLEDGIGFSVRYIGRDGKTREARRDTRKSALKAAYKWLTEQQCMDS